MSDWYGFEREDFVWNGFSCVLVKPEKPLPGRPFVWRSEFFGAFASVDLEMVKRGYYLTYIGLSDQYGCPWAVERMYEYYRHLTGDLGLGPKAIVFGFSRGGLYTVNFALAHPDCVDRVYLDAPVLDALSWPRGLEKQWNELLECFGVTEETVRACPGARPVMRAREFAALGIPTAIVAGGADRTVPYAENAKIFLNDYIEAGGRLYVRVKPDCDHHPHSVEDPTPVADFIAAHR